MRPRQEFPAQDCVTQLLVLCVVGTLLHLPLVCLPVAAVSVQHCKANSTLNMSLLRLGHAKGKKKKGTGREEVGKLLRRQIPPLFEALMLIHSERTSCLSAYTASLLCLPLCFQGSFFSLSSCLTASFNSVFFSAVQLSCLFSVCFKPILPFFFFFFILSSPLTSHQHLIGMCHSALPSSY